MLQTYSLKEGNIEKGTEKGLPCCVTTKTRGQKGDSKSEEGPKAQRRNI